MSNNVINIFLIGATSRKYNEDPRPKVQIEIETK